MDLSRSQKNPGFLICLIILMLAGVALIAIGLWILYERPPEANVDLHTNYMLLAPIVIGALLLLIGIFLSLGIWPERLTFGKNVIELTRSMNRTEETTNLSGLVSKKTLKQEDREQRASYAKTKILPDRNTSDYNAVQSTKANKLLTCPSGHPMTPMYLLDKDYRILDWNEAFSLVFDRTMEGRQGRSVLEWTYHLDNYQEVLDHGEKAFADKHNLPLIDIETIEYTSLRYGPIKAVKRAFQIPDDHGKCFAWLITMELDFTNPNERSRYKYELLRLNGLEQLWSEYAISYDRVLNSCRVYRDLLDTVLGINDSPLAEIKLDAKVLDLGAGTGNISRRLMDGNSKRTVFAVDKNRVMLDFLKDKCGDLLREDDQRPGVLAIKQDVTSLYGFRDDYFDCVVSNNVFYALADPKACIQAIFRVLKPGGELRMSGPRNDTDLNILFQHIKQDLQSAGKFKEYQCDYEHVEQINRLRLETMLHKWTNSEFCALLTEAGFIITHSSDDVYANQSMLVMAEKPRPDITQENISSKLDNL